MDIGTVTSLIGSLGFPIVACIFIYIEMIKTRNNHKEEMDCMVEALNNNTRVLERLVDKLGLQ